MFQTKENALRSLDFYGPSKGAQKKLLIIKATIECVATLGYERTNYETIGQLVDMKRPHVAYHFPDKNKLFESVIRYVYGVGREMVREALSQEKGGWKKELEQYVNITFAWLDADPGYPAVLTLAFYLSAVNPIYKRMSTDVREAGKQTVADILKTCPKCTTTAARLLLAEKMHDLLVSACLRWLTCVNKTKRATFAEQTFKKLIALLPN